MQQGTWGWQEGMAGGDKAGQSLNGGQGPLRQHREGNGNYSKSKGSQWRVQAGE